MCRPVRPSRRTNSGSPLLTTATSAAGGVVRPTAARTRSRRPGARPRPAGGVAPGVPAGIVLRDVPAGAAVEADELGIALAHHRDVRGRRGRPPDGRPDPLRQGEVIAISLPHPGPEGGQI